MPGGKNWAPMASKPATALANANTLEMAWSGQVSMAGTLPASGGLVVTAALTGEFMAVDANTGCRLTMDLCIALSKMLRRSAALGLTLPVMALATLAQASTDPAVGLRRAVEQIGSGRAQFHRSCAQCDGRNRVNAGTTIYDLRKFPVDDAERFKHSVTQGKGNRPSFKQSLAPEQVAVLWAYLGPVAARNPSKADMLRDILCGRVAPLAVCMADDNPPLSYQVKGQPQGLDVRMASAADQALGRELVVLPFDSSSKKQSSLTHEVNAQRSSGLCETVSGCPLRVCNLGPTTRASSCTPDTPSRKTHAGSAIHPAGHTGGQRAYFATPLGVVQRNGAAPLDRLGELGERGRPRGARVLGISTLRSGWASMLTFMWGGSRHLACVARGDQGRRATDSVTVPRRRPTGRRLLQYATAPVTQRPWPPTSVQRGLA